MSQLRRLTVTAALLVIDAPWLAQAAPMASSRHRAPAAQSLYGQAISRLLTQKRFELSEILHYGVVSQPQRYHLRLRYIAPDRMSQQRDDTPSITIQVGRTQCAGPRRWHCRHLPFPRVPDVVDSFLLPQSKDLQSYLTNVTYQQVGHTTILIHATGDPWDCPPLDFGCEPLVDTGWQQRLRHTRYLARLVIDRHTSLPVSWTSWVAPPVGWVSSRQSIHFSYENDFTITLPHYAKWRCPWWDPPGTRCMKEPGA